MTQHMEALSLANEIRTGGARFKREIAGLCREEGMRRLATELETELSPEVGALRLGAFICSAHRMGHDRARRFLSAAGLHRKTDTRMRNLTQRERNALAMALRSRGT